MDSFFPTANSAVLFKSANRVLGCAVLDFKADPLGTVGSVNVSMLQHRACLTFHMLKTDFLSAEGICFSVEYFFSPCGSASPDAFNVLLTNMP